jgi:2-phosphosulfolactate phosphatase
MDAVDPAQQAKYQVRFDWGPTGAGAIGVGADVLVLADALGDSDVDALLPAGFTGAVVAATLSNAGATATWALEQQVGKGDRFAVAVVAAGESTADGVRFCVEDLLLAGGVIDALAEVGIDYCSPEAASAAAAFQGLRAARSHILSASVTGQRILASAGAAAIDAARDRQADEQVLRIR